MNSTEESTMDSERDDIAIQHGDAFELLKELPDDSAHAAIIDYPWKFDFENGTDRMGFDNSKHEKPDHNEGYIGPISDVAMFGMAPDDAFPELLDELARVLVEGAWLLCMADDRFQDVVREAIRDSEFTFRRNWAWTPNNMGMGYYGRVNHYPVPVATLGKTDRYVQDRGTLFSVDNGRDVDYPTGKPVGLYRQLLESPVISEGERLLEPFCGSAPGAAVARERSLSYWGCDVNPEAVDRARARFSQSSISQWGSIA